MKLKILKDYLNIIIYPSYYWIFKVLFELIFVVPMNFYVFNLKFIIVIIFIYKNMGKICLIIITINIKTLY